MEKILQIHGVSKRYGEKTVLKNVNLDIEKGTVCGLVGRNGCGKTMLLKCISGIIPFQGEILYNGKAIGRDIMMPEKMGALIESPGFLEEYNAVTNLRYLADLTGKSDINYIKQLISTVGLDPKNKLKVGKYSMGMKQRLGLAQAIMDKPELLLLDEPMNGLDNQGVQEMRALLKKINETGTTIIIASHIAEDIQILCKSVVYMDHGEIVERKETGC